MKDNFPSSFKYSHFTFSCFSLGVSESILQSISLILMLSLQIDPHMEISILFIKLNVSFLKKKKKQFILYKLCVYYSFFLVRHQFYTSITSVWYQLLFVLCLSCCVFLNYLYLFQPQQFSACIQTPADTNMCHNIKSYAKVCILPINLCSVHFLIENKLTHPLQRTHFCMPL